MVVTALEIDSCTHSKPASRRRVGTTRWLPVTSPANSPSTARRANARRGEDRRAAQLPADLVDDLLLVQRFRPDDVDRTGDVASVEEEDHGAHDVVEG